MKKVINHIALVVGLFLLPIITFGQVNSEKGELKETELEKQQFESKTVEVSSRPVSATPAYSAVHSNRRSERVFSKQEARIEKHKVEAFPLLVDSNGKAIKTRDEKK